MAGLEFGGKYPVGKTILLVEDEVLIAMDQSSTLEKHGFNVLTVHNAEKAVAAVQERGIDLILMDIDLGRGRMSGTEAAGIILKDHELPIVFLTGHTEKETVEKVKGITRYGYVIKDSGEFVLIESISMAFELFEAHNRLRIKEIESRAVVDNMCCAVLRLNTKGEIIFFSKGAERLFGYSADEVIGSLSVDTINPSIDTAGRDHKKMLEDVFSEPEKHASTENENTCKDGRRIWMAWDNQAVYDAKGSKLYIQSIGRDITEKKQAGKALLRYERIIKHMSDLVTEVDENNIFTFVNEQHETVLGYKQEELIGTPACNVLHPDDVDRAIERYNEMRDNLSSSVDTWRMRHKDGTYRVLECRGTVYIDAGNKKSIIVISHDVTEQAKAGKELKESERRFSAVFEQAPIGIALTNPVTGKYQKVNREHCRILKYDMEELLDCSFQQVTHPDDLETDLDNMGKLIKGNINSFNMEKRFICKDGTIKWVNMTVVPLWEENENPELDIAIIQDITECKKAEQQYLESEKRHAALFEYSPIALWEEDFSEVKQYLEQLRESGIDNFEQYIGNNTDVLIECASRIKVLDVNKIAVEMAGFGSKDEMLGNLDRTLTNSTFDLLRKALITMWQGDTMVELIGQIATPSGEVRDVVMRWQVQCEGKNSMLRVIVSFLDITALRHSEEMLRKSLKEKDYLMLEINHRVKNNLSMISSLINLKDSALGDVVDLSDLKHQINAICIIHEKLYKTEGITHINFKEYIQDLLATIFSSFTTKRVACENNILDMHINTEMAVPLGLIINEIATNAIKHGFTSEDECRFCIAMKEDLAEKQYILTIFNYGEPFPDNINLSNPKTLGLQLISALVRQIGGTIDLRRRPWPMFTIKVPVE